MRTASLLKKETTIQIDENHGRCISRRPLCHASTSRPPPPPPPSLTPGVPRPPTINHLFLSGLHGLGDKNKTQDDLGLASATRSRLAYDELLSSQLVLALRRRQVRGAEPASSSGDGCGGGGGGGGMTAESGADGSPFAAEEEEEGGRAGLVEEGLRRLPFTLTRNQRKCEECEKQNICAGQGASGRLLPCWLFITWSGAVVFMMLWSRLVVCF